MNPPRSTPQRSFRIPDDVYSAAQTAARERGEDLSTIVRAALSNYAGTVEAEPMLLPPRWDPTRDFDDPADVAVDSAIDRRERLEIDPHLPPLDVIAAHAAAITSIIARQGLTP